MSRLLARLPTSTVMGLAFTVPAALIAALLVGDHYLLARRYLAEEGARYGELLAAPILSASQRFLRDGQTAAVQEMIETTGSHRTVREIALVGGDGRVIASSRREWIGRADEVVTEPTYREAAAAARASSRPQHRRVDEGRRMVLVSPVLFQGSAPILGGADRGVLYLKIDHERRMRAVVASILARGAFSALGLVAVSLFLLLWVRVILTRPILGVAERVRAIPEGGPRPALRVAGPSEVAQLIVDVDRMAGDLAAKEQALRASEEQLRQAQRMESVASLAGAMAHDFNNLLTGILGYARLLLDRIGPGDPIRRQLAAIEASAARAADLTSQLLTFSRRAGGRPEPVDLGRALGRTLESIDAALPPGIEFTVETPPSLWTAEVDTTQLSRIVEALCANAREAMPYGGRLSVALANRTLGADDCRGKADARQGAFVTLTVADSGLGFDPEVRKRLFEPFVTTKKGGTSAGFGLATAYGLVKGHDGWIEVESERGQGTQVTVWLPARVTAGAAEPVAAPASDAARSGASPAAPSLPAAPPHVAAVTAPAPVTQEPGTREPAVPASAHVQSRTILAVDDEPTILALARDVLELNGYRVLTARNGEEALRIFREQHATIDLVLLDLTMPVMGGADCFRSMRAIRPGIRVIISSGFSAESSAAEVIREGALDFLAKPYDIQALARVVAAGLQRPEQVSGTVPDVAAAS
jgi:signal transduction histidine kinase/ActR/RegA family two-component response regulator